MAQIEMAVSDFVSVHSQQHGDNIRKEENDDIVKIHENFSRKVVIQITY